MAALYFQQSTSSPVFKMPNLSRFSTLPKELQVLIWHHAVQQTPRIIKLDIDLYTTITNLHGIAKNERTVFGGQLVAQKPPGGEDFTWPPSSHAVLESLSRTCVNAREAVLKEYPDIIRVESASIHEQKEALYLLPYRYGPIRPLGFRDRKYKRLRCHFQKDIFFFRKMTVGYVSINHNPAFARVVYNSYVFAGLQEIKKMDDFRGMLRGIKNLMLETADPEADADGEERRDFHLHTLLGATTNLQNLYVRPRGTTFRDKAIMKIELPDDAWKGELWEGDLAENTPEAIRYELKDIREIYPGVRYRYLDPACYTFKAVDIAAAGDAATSVADKARKARGNWEFQPGNTWDETFTPLVKRLGFTGYVREAKTLKVRSRSSKGGRGGEEVVWVPRPGYIIELKTSAE